MPQDGGLGTAVKAARDRMRSLVSSLRESGVVVAGMIGDPDPYTAVMNAVQFFLVSEIVISTLPGTRSRWVADKLVERVQKAVDSGHLVVQTRVAAVVAASSGIGRSRPSGSAMS